MVCHPGPRLTLIPQMLAVVASNGSQLQALPRTCQGLKGDNSLKVLLLPEQLISKGWLIQEAQRPSPLCLYLGHLREISPAKELP